MLSPEISGFIGSILEMCHAQFPRKCSMCGKHYETFEAFVRETRPIGVLPDLTDVDDPLGFLSLANCACGTTIALKCEDAATHAAFLAALGRESSSSKRSATEVLTELRDEVRGLAMRQG